MDSCKFGFEEYISDVSMRMSSSMDESQLVHYLSPSKHSRHARTPLKGMVRSSSKVTPTQSTRSQSPSSAMFHKKVPIKAFTPAKPIPKSKPTSPERLVPESRYDYLEKQLLLWKEREKVWAKEKELYEKKIKKVTFMQISEKPNPKDEYLKHREAIMGKVKEINRNTKLESLEIQAKMIKRLQDENSLMKCLVESVNRVVTELMTNSHESLCDCDAGDGISKIAILLKEPKLCISITNENVPTKKLVRLLKIKDDRLQKLEAQIQQLREASSKELTSLTEKLQMLQFEKNSTEQTHFELYESYQQTETLSRSREDEIMKLKKDLQEAMLLVAAKESEILKMSSDAKFSSESKNIELAQLKSENSDMKMKIQFYEKDVERNLQELRSSLDDKKMQLLSMYETNARLENSLAESLRKQREIENNLLLKTLENQEIHIQIDNAKYEAALCKNETVKLKHLIKDRENEISKHVDHIQELQNKLILHTKQSLAAEQKIAQLDKQLADAVSKINELEAKNEALEYKLVEADNGTGESSKEDKNSFSKMIQELEIQMLQVKLNYEHELEKINYKVGTYEEELDSLRRENEYLKAAWPTEAGKADKMKDWIMCSITIASSMEELLERNVQQ